jgi:hypothetical protein
MSGLAAGLSRKGLAAIATVAVSGSLALLPLSRALVSADKRMRPLTHEEVAQPWIGLSEDELYVLRVDLRQDGTGVGGYVFAQEEPQLFRVVSWQYDGTRVQLVTEPLSNSATAFHKVTGTLEGVAMELSLKGRGWQRKVHLRQEVDLEQRWERLRSSMIGFPPSS